MKLLVALLLAAVLPSHGVDTPNRHTGWQLYIAQTLAQLIPATAAVAAV